MKAWGPPQCNLRQCSRADHRPRRLARRPLRRCESIDHRLDCRKYPCWSWARRCSPSGLRHREQRFNATGARAQATMLTLAAITLILHRGVSDRALGASAAVGVGPAQCVDIDRPARCLRAVSRLHLGDPFFIVLGFPCLGGGSSHSPSWSVRRAALVLGAATMVDRVDERDRPCRAQFSRPPAPLASAQDLSGVCCRGFRQRSQSMRRRSPWRY